MSTTEEMMKKMLELSEAQAKSNKEFQATMQATMQQFQQGMMENLTRLSVAGGKGKDDSDDDDDSGTTVNEEDLESMPRKQFMELITNGIIKHIDKTIKPLKGEIASTKETTVREKVMAEVKELKSGRGKDFDEWKAELTDLIKNNPLLSASDAYDLVRARNPQKADEMDKKFFQGKYVKQESKGDEGSEGNRKPRFGGMRNGSGKDDERPTNLDAKQSAEAAWEEVMSDLPADILTG